MDTFAQEVLERARAVHDPTVDDRVRVRAKLAARIGATGAVTAAGATGKLLASVWTKVALSLVAAGAIGALAYARVAPHAPTTPTIASTAAEATPPRDLAPPLEGIATVPTAITIEPSPSAAPATHTNRRPASPPVSTDNFEAEMRALADAQSAIQRGDFSDALAKLDAQEKSFPSGALTEERTAARVVALCDVGRTDEARTLGKTFLARYTRSPLATRVRSSCATP